MINQYINDNGRRESEWKQEQSCEGWLELETPEEKEADQTPASQVGDYITAANAFATR